jgi:hypothetical protein
MNNSIRKDSNGVPITNVPGSSKWNSSRPPATYDETYLSNTNSLEMTQKPPAPGYKKQGTIYNPVPVSNIHQPLSLGNTHTGAHDKYGIQRQFTMTQGQAYLVNFRV